jgi:hypothetical protein
MVIIIAVMLLMEVEKIKEDARFTEGHKVQVILSNTDLSDIGLQLYKYYFINQIKLFR